MVMYPRLVRASRGFDYGAPMELGAIGNVAATNVQRNVDSVQVSSAAASTAAQTSNVQTANAVQQAASPPSMEQVKRAVDEINKSMQAMSRGLVFSVDQDSHKTVVKVVDQQTEEVIRQIPSEEAIAISRSIDQAIGKLVNKTA